MLTKPGNASYNAVIAGICELVIGMERATVRSLHEHQEMDTRLEDDLKDERILYPGGALDGQLDRVMWDVGAELTARYEALRAQDPSLPK